MATWRLLPRWVRVTAIIAVCLVVFYCTFFAFPATPMTVARAERIFAEGVQPGQSRESVEGWLTARDIRSGSGPYASNVVTYSVLKRHEDVTRKGWWMDCHGNRTVAECAGLDVDTVYSVIRVTYHEADRYLMGWTEICVYLFFDVNGVLIRHWVSESDYSL